MSEAAPAVPSLRPQPLCSNRRLLLHAVRRMGGHGLHDAFAVQTLMGSFGMAYRRPLMVLRALMAEMARVSERSILLMPCCCHRMTADEAMMVAIIAESLADPVETHAGLCTLLDVGQALGCLTSAQALGQAFADLGRPLDQPAVPASPIERSIIPVFSIQP